MKYLGRMASLAAFAVFMTQLTLIADQPKLIGQVLNNKGRNRPQQDTSPFSIPWDRYQSNLNDLPIGVFDSGIGGLTVLEEILKLDKHNNQTGAPGADGTPDFANERFIYFGDQANMPYGNYSSVNKTDFLRQLILRDVLFLIGNQYWPSSDSTVIKPANDKLPVKAIVIACNTATAYGLEDIRSALDAWQIPIPVIGVVEAGGRGVLDIIRTDPLSSATAVLATVGTCDSQAYPRTIAKLAGEQGLRVPIVWQQGSVGLAGAIEGSPAFVTINDSKDSATRGQVDYQGPSISHSRAQLKPELEAIYGFDPAGVQGSSQRPDTWRITSVDNYIRYDVATLVEGYRLQGGKVPIQTVVLGCTHFPLAESAIRTAFERLREYRASDGTQPYKGLIAAKLDLVNPGQDTAKELFRTLTLKRLRRQSATADEAKVASGFFVSVPFEYSPAVRIGSDGGFEYEYKYGRDLDTYQGIDFRVVPFHRAPKLNASIQLWRGKLPHVAELLDANGKKE